MTLSELLFLVFLLSVVMLAAAYAIRHMRAHAKRTRAVEIEHERRMAERLTERMNTQIAARATMPRARPAAAARVSTGYAARTRSDSYAASSSYVDTSSSYSSSDSSYSDSSSSCSSDGGGGGGGCD